MEMQTSQFLRVAQNLQGGVECQEGEWSVTHLTVSDGCTDGDDHGDDHGDDTSGGWDACAGKDEGDVCTLCDPKDLNCVETGAMKACRRTVCTEDTSRSSSSADGSDNQDNTNNMNGGSGRTLRRRLLQANSRPDSPDSDAGGESDDNDSFDCRTREVWSDEKTRWCCDNEGLGCGSSSSNSQAVPAFSAKIRSSECTMMGEVNVQITCNPRTRYATVSAWPSNFDEQTSTTANWEPVCSGTPIDLTALGSRYGLAPHIPADGQCRSLASAAALGTADPDHPGFVDVDAGVVSSAPGVTALAAGCVVAGFLLR
jgi:hypothetical protein